LTLNNVSAGQAGNYTVTVTDAVGTTNSNPAALTLHTAPVGQLAATLAPVTGLATLNDNSGQYSFDVAGASGATYVVQASSDLKNWTSVQTNVAPFTFVDNSASAGQLFYRVFTSSGN
jgi:hypothetical protein